MNEHFYQKLFIIYKYNIRNNKVYINYHFYYIENKYIIKP